VLADLTKVIFLLFEFDTNLQSSSTTFI